MVYAAVSIDAVGAIAIGIRAFSLRRQVKCFKYYHQVESVECTGAAIYTCYQKPVQCVASVLPADHTEGANDIFRGWYDVQRCGKTNDYCFWDGASGVKALVIPF